MNALEPLWPALHTLVPLGLPRSSLAGWFAYANEVQAARLAGHLTGEFSLIADVFAPAVDDVYLRSDGFRANVVQAVRAAEVAESEEKLRLIARALAGCALVFPAPTVNKFQAMRLIEQVSEREWGVLVTLLAGLDPLEPFSQVIPLGARVPGLSRTETDGALLGLQQLGVLLREGQQERVDEWTGAVTAAGAGWRLSALARQVVRLTRLGEFPGT